RRRRPPLRVPPPNLPRSPGGPMSDLMVMALGVLLAMGPTTARAQDQPATKPAQQPAQQPAAEQPVQAPPINNPALPDLNSQASYGFGLNIGRTLKMQAEQFQLDARLVARGIADGLNDGEPMLTDEQLAQVMQQFEQQLLARQMEAEEAMAEQ